MTGPLSCTGASCGGMASDMLTVDTGRPGFRKDFAPDPVAFDSTVFRFYQDVIGLRNAHRTLRRGSFETLVADDSLGAFAFRRTLAGDTLVVVLNRSDAARRVPLAGAARMTVVFSTGEDPAPGADDVRLPGLTGAVLRPSQANE